MDAAAKKRALSATSLQSLETALDELDRPFVTSASRERVVRLLKLVPPSVGSENEYERDNLLLEFSRSTYQRKYLSASSRERAARMLSALKDEVFSGNQPLAERMADLNIHDDAERATIWFRLLFDGCSITPDCAKVLNSVGAISFSANERMRKVIVFGRLEDAEFWEQLKDVHAGQPTRNFPAFEVLKSLVSYYGSVEPSEVHLDS